MKSQRKAAGPEERDRSAVADATRILREMNESKTSLARPGTSRRPRTAADEERDAFNEKEIWEKEMEWGRQERSKSVATAASGEKFRERFMELQKELE